MAFALSVYTRGGFSSPLFLAAKAFPLRLIINTSKILILNRSVIPVTVSLPNILQVAILNYFFDFSVFKKKKTF
ncbi:hypothetical protein BM525_21740 (plasmid) [Alteromonas mediterranea]|uniref:Uncharacterized protein n=1 Tax=Alteromonas mediterranea TaxID=314275 RepID=A0AAC9JEW1_9ALTE|nr:hypothetical protein BM524_21520 [Alteromonas mediterranea]APE00346.1 hypothetical protein BM525_21740 [Alteromonas mediterranea]